jgi:hypothetical protein
MFASDTVVVSLVVAVRQLTHNATIVVTPGFKGKSECIEHMCARIKLHTCVDSVYTKTQCKSVKRVLKLYYTTECLKIVT